MTPFRKGKASIPVSLRYPSAIPAISCPCKHLRRPISLALQKLPSVLSTAFPHLSPRSLPVSLRSTTMDATSNEFTAMRKRHIKAARSTDQALDVIKSILNQLNQQALCHSVPANFDTAPHRTDSVTLDNPESRSLEATHSATETLLATATAAADPMLVEHTQQDSPPPAQNEADSMELLNQLHTASKSLQTSLVSDHKSVGAAINKFGKSIDNSTAANLGELCASAIRLKTTKINDAIAAHLFREGMFDVGRTFLTEAHVFLEDDHIRPFEQLYRILTAFRRDDLAPAIAWTADKRELLCHSSSDLEFRLHRLAYLQILQRGDRDGGLAYARKHFSAFPEHIAAVQKLMTCLLYAPDIDASPYKDMVNPSYRDEIERCLSREYCRAQGLARDSLLLTVIRCGTKAIPTLIKASRVAPNLRELGMDDTLPVEVDVGRDCQFHSIFTCPVSKEEASESNNVPMILPCGHVLSKQSITRLPRGSTRFKCPYCPMEQVISECRELHF